MVSRLLEHVKEMLRKKHFDFEYHLSHLSSEHKIELGPGLHSHSAYLMLHLPAVRSQHLRAAIASAEADNEFFDYISFCLLRAFSGSVSPEVAIFILDQCLILGFSTFLPIVTCSLLLGSSGELLALESCDSAVECFDNYCRLMTVGNLRR